MADPPKTYQELKDGLSDLSTEQLRLVAKAFSLDPLGKRSVVMSRITRHMSNDTKHGWDDLLPVELTEALRCNEVMTTVIPVAEPTPVISQKEEVYVNEKRSGNWLMAFIAALVAAVLIVGFLTNWGQSVEVNRTSSDSMFDEPEPTPQEEPNTGATSGSEDGSDNGTTSDKNDKLAGKGNLPAFDESWNQDGWDIKGNLGDDPIVESWLRDLRTPAPEDWPTYPNIPNPDVPAFDVANGLEYGVANVPFCQQDQRCDYIVPAWHYRLYTGDYGFLNLSCDGDGKTGCLLLVINVMDQSFTWRDQMFDNGFTVPGRYWNGDELDWAVWGLVSHASANMLNMETSAHPDESLNFGDDGANAGANCGTPKGCGSVDVTVIVHAGDRVLAVAHTVVSR